MGLFSKLFKSYSEKELKHIHPIADSVVALADKYRAMSDSELRATTPALKARLQNGETLSQILPDAFATCREAATRTVGMTHFPVQVVGGVTLHEGKISEMKTGEGKTLVATLPAYLNALTGEGVHIVTVNDYLARRDSEWMGKIYKFLGLSVGLIVHGLNTEERRAAYACDITYGTNNELGFDYLRDNMVVYKEERVMRGFHYAIVDEVDSILIDEARTPLIISGQGDKSTDLYERANKFARTLKSVKVKEMDMKAEQDDIDADYIIDEKAKTATLTKAGVKKAEAFFNVENLMDPDNMTLSHHINQAIKASGVMQRDVDYVVKDGEIIIVDEFTGRLMLGRRYNEGLHQAIEAKEGVTVLRESKTLATITFQNYFRLYKKLAGMTGTALTEEEEFREIYGLDSVEIPTNRPVVRVDHPDVVYKTEEGKFKAVIEQIKECHAKGQPVLAGTISIEKSELLSSMLKRQGIPHHVLNAKHHEKEAMIVAQAGKLGAVTIATNMAGRGTDIMLGGNPEYDAKERMRKEEFTEEELSEATGHADIDDERILEARRRYKALYDEYKAAIADEQDKVRRAGGLFILGTERHESRRIDNQLRGRAGRQGDPGESRFFVSVQDDLMRLFGGERLEHMMDTLGVDDDMPIENKILSNTLETAQSRVETRNFQIRKNVLQFDDVMNRQREIIYGQRSQVLDGEDLHESILKMFDESVEATVDQFCSDEDIDGYNITGLYEHFYGIVIERGDGLTLKKLQEMDKDEIKDVLGALMFEKYGRKEEQYGVDLMREVERMILLRNVDTKWMDHIDAMDELRRGIYLRSYGQRDPVVEYRIEGFDMFDELVASIREDTVRMLLTIQLRQEQPKRERVAPPEFTNKVGGDASVKKQPVKASKKPGRNDPCPCGSGKKYKKCCGMNE